MKTSESVKEIIPALLNAQKTIQNVKATKANEFFGYHYADLSDVISAVKGPLNENGIVIIQGINSNGEIVVTTRLQHTSGEYIETDFTVPPVENKKSNPVQAMGAGVTYARRYSLSALCGLASEEDTDGEGLTKKAEQKKPEQKKTDLPEENKVLGSQINQDINLAVHSGAMTTKEGTVWKDDLKNHVNDIARLKALHKRLKTRIADLEGEAVDKEAEEDFEPQAEELDITPKVGKEPETDIF